MDGSDSDHDIKLQADRKNIWLLSAYRSDSHAAWADWLHQTFNEFNWHILELPGRHFRWRIRGNPLSWLYSLPETRPDLILATSMVDLATLKGLHPRIASVPCIYYFHENQFDYPVSEQQHQSVDPQMVQLYGALSADRLLFNSHYNRDSFLQGISGLLQKLPDEVPQGVTTTLQEKSEILPVPVQPVQAADKIPQLILWNHRWEYDKAPQVFADALLALQQSGADFKLALLGDRPPKTPQALKLIEDKLASHIIVNGKVPRNEYERYLSQASIVVSTAIHEFQGLAILEAVSAGAVPLVPDALCYVEQYDSNFRYKNGDSKALSEKLQNLLQQNISPPDVSDWYAEQLRRKWHDCLESTPNIIY